MSELHSDDMQERHWTDLSKEIGQTIKPDESGFCFKDMYKLKLHNYSEKISDVVDIAKNQKKIKKEIESIKKTWDKRKFVWKELPDKDTALLEKTEEIIDIVDQDSGKLDTMLTQKK